MELINIVICNLGQSFSTIELRDQYYAYIYSHLTDAGLHVTIVDGDEHDEDLTIRQLQNADAVLFSSNGIINERVLSALPRLKLVMRYGIGLNSIDMDACTRHGVIVCNTPGYCDEEIATHAVALGLAALRNLRYYDANIRTGIWLKGNGPLPLRPGRMCIGIFGLGASGKIVAKIMSSGFGSKVIAFDPYARQEAADALGVELVSFDELLSRSDMLFIHAPLTDETYHIFNSDAFRRMKKTAILVNVSRGPIVDNAALNQALEHGEIQKAAFDVFEEEPLPTNSPLLSQPHLLATPHNAYYGKEAIDNVNILISTIMADALIAHKLYQKHLRNPAVLEKLDGYTLTGEEIPL